jgi:hypothetical protein
MGTAGSSGGSKYMSASRRNRDCNCKDSSGDCSSGGSKDEASTGVAGGTAGQDLQLLPPGLQMDRTAFHLPARSRRPIRRFREGPNGDSIWQAKYSPPCKR